MARYRSTIDRLRAPLVVDEATGDERRDWTSPSIRPAPLRANVQPAGSDELTDRRQVVITRWTVSMPLADVEPTDRFRWRGDDYDVDGDVGRFDGRGPGDHLEFTLTRTT